MKYVNLVEGVAVAKVNAGITLFQEDGYYPVTDGQFVAMKLPARVTMEDGVIVDWVTIPFDEMPVIPEPEPEPEPEVEVTSDGEIVQ